MDFFKNSLFSPPGEVLWHCRFSESPQGQGFIVAWSFKTSSDSLLSEALESEIPGLGSRRFLVVFPQPAPANAENGCDQANQNLNSDFNHGKPGKQN